MSTQCGLRGFTKVLNNKLKRVVNEVEKAEVVLWTVRTSLKELSFYMRFFMNSRQTKREA
jgi:hypothetical protein